jgi:RNA-directed DNA polymerase
VRFLWATRLVITGNSPELLTEKVIPIVIESLKEVGLELSQEKSKITHIDKGFNFLGFNVRKYRGTLLIKPSKDNINIFLKDIRSTIKANYSAKTENLINLLNPKIRGWANYFRGSVSSKAYSYVDDVIYKALRSWMLHRHPNKSKSWIVRKYFISRELSNWNFHAMIKDKNGNKIPLYLYHASETPIERHIKITSEAHPYDPKFRDYFKHRESTSKTRLTNSKSSLAFSTRLLGGNAALLRA